MGAGESIPREELQDLKETTNFKKQELERWYSKFKKDYPNGQLNKAQFMEMYKNIYKSRNRNNTVIAEHIFRTFDANNDGSISFKELMTSLSITSRGTAQEKLEWVFGIYDIDGSGSITMEEISHIVTCMKQMANANTIDEGNKISQEEVEAMFKTMDINADGQLTLTEFIDGVEKYPKFITMLNGQV